MRRAAVAALVAAALIAGCSSDSNTSPTPEPVATTTATSSGPTVVVSFPLLADVVAQVAGESAIVDVIHRDGRAGPLTTAQHDLVSNADLVLVHDSAVEQHVLAAASSPRAAATSTRVEIVNDWLDPAPVAPATWFDPIQMARITLRLGEILAEVDDGQRSIDEWYDAAAQVATSIASSFDDAMRILSRVPDACRRATGEPDLLASLGYRFGVRVAEPEDAGAADLSGVTAVVNPGQHWQDWFMSIIELAATASPTCVTPSPGPSPTPSP